MKILLFSILIFLISCEPGGPGKSENNEIKESDSGITVTRFEVDGKYSLLIPDFLIELQNKNSKASFQYYNLERNVVYFVYDLSKDSIGKHFENLKNNEGPDDLLIDIYSKFTISELKSKLTNVYHSEVTKRSINGLNGRIFTLSGKTNKNIWFKYMCAIVESTDRFYYIETYCQANEFEIYKVFFEEAINFFEVNSEIPF